MSNKRNTAPSDSESRNWEKIPFRITHVSSQDPDYQVRELLNHTPFSRGWLSARFCNYPQELLLQFQKPIRMREIQFLSHQYNIASKIEIYILSPQSDKFKKIGYLSLDSNERSNFQARELKTVYTDYNCIQVKFNLMRCHTNTHNIYAQVGLIAISILGEYPNRLYDINRVDNLEDNFGKLEDEMIYDPATLKRLKDLYKAKQKAVEFEDFDEAKRIKVAIDSLKSVSQSLIKLEERKKIAIKNDDFDSAKLIKCEIDRLRNAVAGVNLNEMNRKIREQNEYNNNNNLNEPTYNTQKFNEPQQPRLFPGRKENEYQPINNEYEMDADEDLYRIRNNINNGYQLENPIDNQRVGNNIPFEQMVEEQMKNQNNKNMSNINKNINNNNMNNQNYNNIGTGGIGAKPRIIDVDSQKVGNTKDFNQMLEEQLKLEGHVEKDNIVEESSIPAEYYKIAEPLIPVLSFQIIKQIFSKVWKSNESGFKQLQDEVAKYPNSALFGNKSTEEIVVATLGACAFALQNNISQSLIAAMEMIKVIFQKFRNIHPEGNLRIDFDKYANDCIRLLIERIGENNLKLKEKAENTLLEFANYNLIGSRVLFEHLISGQIKKTLANSQKHLIGRYNFLTRLIGNFGYNESEVPLSSIMTYAIKGYKNSQNTVRQAALELITSVYRYAGDKVRSYYQDLRPAQINTIEDALANADGLDDYVGNNTNNEMVNNSQMLNQEQQNEYSENNNKMMMSSSFANKNIDDTEHTCQFCGLFDPNFTSEEIEIHQFKECPMLIPCFKCNQICEISGLNEHYLKECQFKKEFKVCNRCKEPILVRDYDSHVKDKSCNQFQSPNVCNRCPLCHTDIVPAGKVGWEVHLMQQTCPNNPRTNS